MSVRIYESCLELLINTILEKQQVIAIIILVILWWLCFSLSKFSDLIKKNNLTKANNS